MHLTTRARILDILQKQNTASVSELGRALAKTGANIRHHLALLEQDDLVEVICLRREGRGRPAAIYRLSRRVLGDGLEELVDATLDVWFANTTELMRTAGMKAIALRFSGKTPNAIEIQLPRRMGLMINRLNQLHYQASWEAGKEGPRIILGQCPYAEIINRHPELCQMDAFLLEQWINSHVEQTARLQPSARGYLICCFQVPNKHRLYGKT
jgi:predicted ArsR family transcriptional regulator